MSSIDLGDLGLLGQHMLTSIVRDEGTEERCQRVKNNRNHYQRMTNWFDSYGGVPRIPTVIYEFDAAGAIIPVVYEDIRKHPKVKSRIGRDIAA